MTLSKWLTLLDRKPRVFVQTPCWKIDLLMFLHLCRYATIYLTWNTVQGYANACLQPVSLWVCGNKLCDGRCEQNRSPTNIYMRDMYLVYILYRPSPRLARLGRTVTHSIWAAEKQNVSSHQAAEAASETAKTIGRELKGRLSGWLTNNKVPLLSCKIRQWKVE